MRLYLRDNWIRLLLVTVLFLAGFTPGVARADKLVAGNVARVSVPEKWIALTFDAHDSGEGSQPDVKAALKVLRRNHLHCTLFLTGQYLELEPEIVRWIVKDGHEVANHTYDHPYMAFRTVTREQFLTELLKTQGCLEQRYYHKMAAYWRAPYGRYNAALLEWAREAGYQHIGWTVDMLDWIGDPGNVKYLDDEGLVRRFETFVDKDAAGYIFLMHLNANRVNSNMAQVLQQMIDYGEAKGYRFVTVSELLNKGSQKPVAL